MSALGAWTDQEGHTGLWVASFPALQPLIRNLLRRLGLSTANRSYGQSRNGASNRSGTNNLGESRTWVTCSRFAEECLCTKWQRG